MSWQMLGESAQRFKDFVPKGCSVLEIGCSSGSFLSHIQKDYDPYGLEWNPDDAAYVRDVGELPCEEGTLDDCYPGRRFGAIAALQVLEHQADPVAFLKQVRSRLIGGGYLYLELPNASNILLTAIDAPAYRDFFYTEPHITYWEPETLATALQALGFEAAVSVRQRYGIANHINWFLHGKPMADSKQGTDYLEMVPKEHPLYGIMSRTTGKLDKEYRVQLTTLKGGDIITAACRKRDI